MSEAIIATSQGVTLVGGGLLQPGDLALARAHAPVIVAADGGANGLISAGVMPDAVIGDFDSISAEARGAIPPDRLHPVTEQETTDFEKCLLRIAAPFVIGLGFLGGRFDHQLGVMNVLARHDRAPVILLGAEDIVFRAPPQLSLDLTAGTRVSLFPMSEVKGESRGLRWPLDGLALSPGGRIATSNEALGPVRLDIEGQLLVILPRALFGALMANVNR